MQCQSSRKHFLDGINAQSAHLVCMYQSNNRWTASLIWIVDRFGWSFFRVCCLCYSCAMSSVEASFTCIMSHLQPTWSEKDPMIMSQKPRIHSQEYDKMTFSVPPDANGWQSVKKSDALLNSTSLKILVMMIYTQSQSWFKDMSRPICHGQFWLMDPPGLSMHSAVGYSVARHRRLRAPLSPEPRASVTVVGSTLDTGPGSIFRGTVVDCSWKQTSTICSCEHPLYECETQNQKLRRRSNRIWRLSSFLVGPSWEWHQHCSSMLCSSPISLHIPSHRKVRTSGENPPPPPCDRGDVALHHLQSAHDNSALNSQLLHCQVVKGSKLI